MNKRKGGLLLLIIIIFSILITGCIPWGIVLRDTEEEPEARKEIPDVAYQDIRNNQVEVRLPEKITEINMRGIPAFNQSFFIKNRENLVSEMKDNSMVVLFSGESHDKVTFSPNRNFYYLTGIDEENSLLLLIKKNDKVQEKLFTQMPNPSIERWTGKMMTLSEAQTISGIDKILSRDTFNKSFIKEIEDGIDNLYLDLQYDDSERLLEKKADFTAQLTREELLAIKVNNNYPKTRIIQIKKTIEPFRMIKTDEEIQRMKRAIEITGEGIKALMRQAKPGMMEYQLESYFDFTIKKLGAEEYAFLTIAASGENATIAHYQDNNDEIQNGELILFDLGAAYDHYSSDITRTFPVNGKFTKRQKEIYNIVLKAQLETMKAVKPGITLIELNAITKRILTEECMRIGLIDSGAALNKYYFHSVGHYLGLDTHDLGNFREPLKAGTVITVEPGLYIEEEGIGIRIEDNVLVTKEGAINLSENIIKTVEEIEAFMKEQ